MAIQIISIDAVRQWVAEGKPFRLIDVRTPAEYARAHARGALSIPLEHLNPAELARGEDPDDAPIYLICQSGGRSAKACEKLVSANVPEVFSVDGGTVAWEAAGLPVERGPGKVISLERQVRIAAGALVVIGALLAWVVHPLFLVLPLFVGSGLVFAGITDFCGMGLLLARMPWNARNCTASGK